MSKREPSRLSRTGAGYLSVSVNKKPLLLSVETATRAGSVALMCGAAVLATRTGDAAVSHSSHLLRHVRDVLEEARVTLAALDLFAVATGPGSFTGLRIGLATIKSFAATLKKPCAAVPTLHAIAHAAGESKHLVALLPAGRGELFAQLLRVEHDGAVTTLDAPANLRLEQLLERVKKIRPLRWAGEGALARAAAIRDYAVSEGIQFLDELEERELFTADSENRWTLAPGTGALAPAVGALSLLSWERGEVLAPEHLRADYVRPSDAEINEQCRA